MRLRSLFVLSAFVAACSDPSGPEGRAPRIEQLPRALSTGEQHVIAASNAFGIALLQELERTQSDSNIFMSPLSASMALGMTMNGAQGETFNQMRQALAFGSVSRAEINDSYRSLIDLLRGLDPKVDFRIANSIWYRATFPFHQAFLDEAQQYFDAKVAGLDFDAPSAAPTINDWVNTATNGKIKDIVEAPIDADVVMYLINAIYFNGSWTTRFDKSRTGPDRFTTIDGTTEPVQMMRKTDVLRVAQTSSMNVVELPYGGDAYAMTILLPKDGMSIGDLVASLTPEVWNNAIAFATNTEVELHLPKFKLRWESTLNDQLEALGMELPFKRGGADFTRMSPEGDGLYISEVKQKSYVDVHEEGTEAAAATSVEISFVCTCGPSVIRVDRPFVFAIRERLSGTILFMGKIVRPPAA